MTTMKVRVCVKVMDENGIEVELGSQDLGTIDSRSAGHLWSLVKESAVDFMEDDVEDADFGHDGIPRDDCDDWKREAAMHAGMAFGCRGYNDAMGY